MNTGFQNLFRLLVINHGRFIDRESSYAAREDALRRSTDISFLLVNTSPPPNEARVMAFEAVGMKIKCYGLTRTEYSVSMINLLVQLINHMTNVATEVEQAHATD